MSNRIPEALRQILTEQYKGDQLDKILAQAFNYGISVVFHPDGSRVIFPETVLEVGVDVPSDDDLTAIETRPGDWDRLVRRPPTETEIAVFPGNFGQGAQGKHDKNTWGKDDFTNNDAPMRRGYGGRGHRGGLRQATSRPVLMKLFNQPSKLRRYR